jgi:transcriptional antiterminator NusG
MEWYSLFVITGQEENVAEWLQLFFPEQRVRILIPKRKLVERRQGKCQSVLKKLFPGYVFINIEMDSTTYYRIKKVPNVIRILNSGQERYTRVFQEEINFIQRLLGEGDTVEYSFVYLENSQIVVKSGPLKGLEGLIKSVDRRKKRAKVLIPFMGLEKEIDVGIEMIDKVNSGCEGGEILKSSACNARRVNCKMMNYITITRTNFMKHCVAVCYLGNLRV